MGTFPRIVEYKGFRICRTSFSWRVKEDNTEYAMVDSIPEGKEMVDKILCDRAERLAARKTKAKETDLEEALR